MEVEHIENEAKANIEMKQHELELRRKRREIDRELEAQKEKIEFAEMKRQQHFALKLKKIELLDKNRLLVVFPALVSLLVCGREKLDHE